MPVRRDMTKRWRCKQCAAAGRELRQDMADRRLREHIAIAHPTWPKKPGVR